MAHNPIIVQLEEVVYTATYQPPVVESYSFLGLGRWTYEKRGAINGQLVLSGGPLVCLSVEGVFAELTSMALREYSI